ncbi:hypothetical protein FQN54_006367 [Arachnomyces sp. PD_36]|nr:hypothetical protein FQN54_006367 [Arachnomyces sp. PD_36]
MTMHQPKQLAFTLSALLLSSPLARANELSSCLEVECPIQEGTVGADCQVANQTLSVVGVSSLSAPIPGQDQNLELAWTIGAQDYPGVDSTEGVDRYIERVYYLGTPLTKSDNKSLFYKTTPSTDSFSYCQEYLQDDCVSALTSKISELTEDHTLGSSDSDVCSKVGNALEKYITSGDAKSCSSLEDDLVLGSVTLTGPEAAEPLTAKQNSSSNCYPTLPKTNDLTREFSFNVSSSYYINETAPAIQGETPIFTMFWSKEGDDDSSVEEANAQLTCLRPIDMTTAANETMVGGEGDAEGGAIPMNGGSNILGVAAAAGVAVLLSQLV